MLRYIPPALLGEAWPIIEPGLLKITEHSFDPDFPAQIHAAVLAGGALLFMGTEPYQGFVILKQEQTYTGRRGLHVWGVYSEGADFSWHLAEIEQIAREQGCTQVTFSSPRKGWARRLKDYQPTYQIYRKILE